MKSAIRKRRGGIWLFLLLAIVLLALLSGYLFLKKNDIRREFTAFFENRIQNVLGLQFRVERLGGNIFGSLALRGLSVYSQGEEHEKSLVFKADEVTVHYRPLDFLAGRPAAWMRIQIDRPVFYADAPFSPSAEARQRLPRSFELFSRILEHVRKKMRLDIRNGSISWLGQEGLLSGIEGSIEEQQFDLRLSLNHVPTAGNDLSTQIFFKGRLDLSQDRPRLVGHLKTRGTVINWKPITRETRMMFTVTQERFTVLDASILSGIELAGWFGYAETPVIDLRFRAADYPVAYLNEFFPQATNKRLDGTADADITLSGTLFHPMIKGQITLKKSHLGNKPIKNLQLGFEGIYPDLSVSESRVVLEDGSTMLFANQRVQVRELFDTRTYEQMVSRQDQDDVTWGNWRLIRADTQDSVTVERGIGDTMRLKYERFGKDEAQIQTEGPKDELELEYFLSHNESLKMEVKEDDERIVGVQRKVSF